MKRQNYCPTCEETTIWDYQYSIWANKRNNHLYECLDCGSRLTESELNMIVEDNSERRQKENE